MLNDIKRLIWGNGRSQQKNVKQTRYCRYRREKNYARGAKAICLPSPHPWGILTLNKPEMCVLDTRKGSQSTCLPITHVTLCLMRAGRHRDGQVHVLLQAADSGPPWKCGQPRQLCPVPDIQQLHVCVSPSCLVILQPAFKDMYFFAVVQLCPSSCPD